MAKKRKKIKFKRLIKYFFLVIFSMISIIIGFSLDTVGDLIGKTRIHKVGNEILKNYMNKNIFMDKNIFFNIENRVETITKSLEKNIENIIPKEKIEYKVLYISDGDTIAVKEIKKETLVGNLIKIRLYGIDAPEIKQDYGYESKKKLIELIRDKNINIKEINKDKYGRVVGIVYLNGKNINEEMVKGGHAWWYREYDKNNKILEKYEMEAKKNKIGLFAKKGYIEPWKFRKKTKQK